MRDFVRHQTVHGLPRNGLLAVENGAGVLRAAVQSRRLHVPQLLVRIRPDMIAVEIDRLPHYAIKRAYASLPILMKHPRFQRNAMRDPKMPRSELGHPDGIQPRRDRHGLLPVRQPAPIAEIGRLLQQTIRNHLINRGRGDDEFAGGLVVRMVDHGQPLARPVRPVLAEEGALAILIGADPQAAGRNAAVADRES